MPPHGLLRRGLSFVVEMGAPTLNL
jgi:hypothetical protein